jgi:hypothetical protein
LGFSNWPVIYYKPTSFLAPSNAIKFSGFVITVPPSVLVDQEKKNGGLLPDVAAIHRIHCSTAPLVLPPWLTMHPSVGCLQERPAFPAASEEARPLGGCLAIVRGNPRKRVGGRGYLV